MYFLKTIYMIFAAVKKHGVHTILPFAYNNDLV